MTPSRVIEGDKIKIACVICGAIGYMQDGSLCKACNGVGYIELCEVSYDHA